MDKYAAPNASNAMAEELKRVRFEAEQLKQENERLKAEQFTARLVDDKPPPYSPPYNSMFTPNQMPQPSAPPAESTSSFNPWPQQAFSPQMQYLPQQTFSPQAPRSAPPPQQTFQQVRYPTIPLQEGSQRSNKTTRNNNTSAIILGGMHVLTKGSKHIYLFNSKSNTFVKLSLELPVRLIDAGAVYLNDNIYVLGGHYDASSVSNVSRTCYKLNNSGKWTSIASMQLPRTWISSSSVVYLDSIWVIGGLVSDRLIHNVVNSVECYNPKLNKWSTMVPMIRARGYAAAAVINNRLFISGGQNANGHLNSIEVFDPVLRKWTEFYDLPSPISKHCMINNRDNLILISCPRFPFNCNSIIKLEFRQDATWMSKNQTPNNEAFLKNRMNFGTIHLARNILIFGGITPEKELLDTVALADGTQLFEAPNLPIPLCHFAYTSLPHKVEETLLQRFSS